MNTQKEQKDRYYNFRRGQQVKLTYLNKDGQKIRSEIGVVGYIGSAEPIQGTAFQLHVHHMTDKRTVYPNQGEFRHSQKARTELFLHGTKRAVVSPGPSGELFVPVSVKPVRVK